MTLKQGIRIESEHKDIYNYMDKFVRKHGKLPTQKEFFTLIAKDHIKEFKGRDYYGNLIRMEKRLKR